MNMTRIILGIILGVAVLSAQAPAPAGNAANGRKLFENDGCYQCHGREAQGGLGTGPRLGPKPLPFVAIQKYIRQPTGQMPPYTAKVVNDKDLADIYAFLQSVATPPPVKNIPLLNN
jgi:ubiquinol-cytochrome c reductase cytochrome c subunit